jgi:rare lipoprotein A
MTPLRIWLLAGFTLLGLFLGAGIFSAHTVQAHALLSQPAASVPPSVPANALTAPAPVHVSEKTAAAQRKALLRGLATWYGEAFNGRQTASGETYDMNALTACHPTLPFGSLVKVVNLKNGRSVVVRITDRGELAEGRIIDLSKAAADRLAMTERGVVPVVLDVLSRGPR